jgi:hypothetical protein
MIKDTTGVDLPPPPQKMINAEGTIVVQGVAKAVGELGAALADLVRAACALLDAAARPLGQQARGYPQVLHELHRVMERAEALVHQTIDVIFDCPPLAYLIGQTLPFSSGQRRSGDPVIAKK